MCNAAAAAALLQTESMLKTAEGLVGPYVWGQYDILVLPPSFPYGGMENPCLTFATPTLLVRGHARTQGLNNSFDSIRNIIEIAIGHGKNV